MIKSVLPLILVNVLLTSLAQIALKGGMSGAAIAQSVASGWSWQTAMVVFTRPLVIVGLLMYFGSALLWLAVLAKVDVSFAYPFVGLGFIVTMILAWLIHGEALTPMRIAGTVLIALGVAVLASE